jgi:hypothetical protein
MKMSGVVPWPADPEKRLLTMEGILAMDHMAARKTISMAGKFEMTCSAERFCQTLNLGLVIIREKTKM